MNRTKTVVRKGSRRENRLKTENPVKVANRFKPKPNTREGWCFTCHKTVTEHSGYRYKGDTWCKDCHHEDLAAITVGGSITTSSGTVLWYNSEGEWCDPPEGVDA